MLNQINFIESSFDSNSDDFELSKNDVEYKELFKIQSSSDHLEKNLNFEKSDISKNESNKKIDYVSSLIKKIKKNSIFNEKKKNSLEKGENNKTNENLKNSPPPTKKMKSISSIQKTKTSFSPGKNEKEALLKEKQIVEGLMQSAYPNYEGVDFHKGLHKNKNWQLY